MAAKKTTKTKKSNKDTVKISAEFNGEKIKADLCGEEHKKCCNHKKFHGCKDGVLYFFGFVGAAIYYISTATSFWMGVLGFLKAIIWPVFLIFHLLTMVGA